jgi:DNA (cytosine-5)-methyltransferase 1
VARPRLLDLFCGAGGAGRGYADAGFDVTGVDMVPQRRYPFTFVEADALDVLADRAFVASFDAVHASPPCQTYTALRTLAGPDRVGLVGPTRDALAATGLPYVIENVPGAPLVSPLVLCGSMFNLEVRRHRLFELGGWSAPAPSCRHAEQNAASPWYPVRRYHSGVPVTIRSPVIGVYGGGKGMGAGEVNLWRRAMGIAWMTRDELAQAIPPAYTRWLGARLVGHLDAVGGAQRDAPVGVHGGV